jgi:hypothetical protein
LYEGALLQVRTVPQWQDLLVSGLLTTPLHADAN